jgi:hypothetical protein
MPLSLGRHQVARRRRLYDRRHSAIPWRGELSLIYTNEQKITGELEKAGSRRLYAATTNFVSIELPTRKRRL